MPLPIISRFINSRVSNRYWFSGELYGHRDSIFSVAFSNRGHILASASTDGIKLWDVPKRHSLETPPQAHRGGASCVTWATGSGVTAETLCFGTQMGYLVVWRQQQEHFKEVFSRRLQGGHEITCLATDTTWSAMRIAAGTRDRVVVLLKLDNQDSVDVIFAVQLDTTVPSALAFRDMARNVSVFGLHNGYVHTLQGTDGKVVANFETLGGVIGHAAVSAKRGQYVVDNATDGFDVYHLESGNFIRNLPTGSPTKRFPKQVAFGEDSKVIVGGSDHGVVYVFDRKTGVLLDHLHHAKGGMVQAVATHEREGISLIATASAVCSGKNYISVWKYEQRQQGQVRTMSRWSVFGVLRVGFQVAMLVGSILFLYQNQNLQRLALNSVSWKGPGDISAELVVRYPEPHPLDIVTTGVTKGGRRAVGATRMGNRGHTAVLAERRAKDRDSPILL